ncbi:chromosome segregation protein SMC [Trinickia terrae]|uniref:Chromosome segregation protein SMC n=1 Tax=Trinickia terrae TaxID=2571161 RepID=A0A4U1HNQ2_9BURK|nr:AAA family ATPase [Trinickia terrae]TKC82989.1 chromosome segregation protein SMC [Trinickia terrae]
MSVSPFISRVVLRNYRSVGQCDVSLGPLTYLVGANGAGKSNFVDALHLVSDALTSSLDQALSRRGGLAEVRRRSSGHPTHFGIRLEFTLGGRVGHYAFNIGSLKNRGFEVQTEECSLGGIGSGPYYRIEHGQVKASSEPTLPALTEDRLALVALSGLSAFRPIFDALTGMGFYNLNPKLMRELQKAQEGRLMKPEGENIASVIGHLDKVNAQALRVIEEYLQTVVPTVHAVKRVQVGPMETLEFRQDVPGAKDRWRFAAQNMSDGTLRALGVLTALFQSNRDFAPTLIGIEEPETALHPAASAALREALQRASSQTQVIVTSHSPELLDDMSIRDDQIIAVVSDAGESKLARIDPASREAIRKHLFSAGELLKLGQLQPDPDAIRDQATRQASLFDGGAV